MTGTYENGIYREGDVRLSDLSGRRRLPIGRDGFATAVQESVVIDKSLLIADVLNSSAAVTLFCRPRRFGKSLNMTRRATRTPRTPPISSRAFPFGTPTTVAIASIRALIPLSTSASIR